MEVLSFEKMEDVTAGDFITGLCLGIGAGSVIYGVGVATNWWNPIGWVSGTFLAADAACIAYGISKVIY